MGLRMGSVAFKGEVETGWRASRRLEVTMYQFSPVAGMNSYVYFKFSPGSYSCHMGNTSEVFRVLDVILAQKQWEVGGGPRDGGHCTTVIKQSQALHFLYVCVCVHVTCVFPEKLEQHASVYVPCCDPGTALVSSERRITYWKIQDTQSCAVVSRMNSRPADLLPMASCHSPPLLPFALRYCTETLMISSLDAQLL